MLIEELNRISTIPPKKTLILGLETTEERPPFGPGGALLRLTIADGNLTILYDSRRKTGSEDSCWSSCNGETNTADMRKEVNAILRKAELIVLHTSGYEKDYLKCMGFLVPPGIPIFGVVTECLSFFALREPVDLFREASILFQSSNPQEVNVLSGKNLKEYAADLGFRKDPADDLWTVSALHFCFHSLMESEEYLQTASSPVRNQNENTQNSSKAVGIVLGIFGFLAGIIVMFASGINSFGYYLGIGLIGFGTTVFINALKSKRK